MSKMQELGTFEEIVLLAVAQVGEGAYGVSIADAIERATGKEPAPGMIYATLDRLEAKGFVTTWMGAATAARGGRAKRCCRIEGAGEDALRQIEEVRGRLRVPARNGASGRLRGAGGAA